MARTLGLGSDGKYYWIDLAKPALNDCIVAATGTLTPNQKGNVDQNVIFSPELLNSLVTIGTDDESTYKYTSEHSSSVVIGFLLSVDDSERILYIEKQYGAILRPGSAEELARTKPTEELDYSNIEDFNLPGGEAYETYLQTTLQPSQQQNKYDNDDILDLRTRTTAAESTSKKRPREDDSKKVPDKLQAMLRQRNQELQDAENESKKGPGRKKKS